MDSQLIFDDIVTFPDPTAAARFARLVGLDTVKDRLIKEARLLLKPELLEEWSSKHHGRQIRLLDEFRNRSPLFVLGGDVGTGKTSLAETFGDAVAREEDIHVSLYRLSLKARGAGAVGEMTRLITEAFREVGAAARKGVSKGGGSSSAVILLIDEADALAQSRAATQMHHEDRAGVNALIRGIDALAGEHLPAIVVMCTNRLDSLDPAVRRRAAEVFEFTRPNDEQRRAVLETALEGVDFNDEELQQLVQATGSNGGRPYGYTYSDLLRRLLPSLLLDAFPDRPIVFERALELARSQQPTPSFRGDDKEAASA